MSAFDERRNQDVQKLTQLASKSGGRLKVGKISGNPTNHVEIEIHLKTAGSTEYPSKAATVSKLQISLPARYPFVEPSVTFTTPILHPNVYSSGKVCLGVKWLPTSGLDLLVKRLAQIIAFDPVILNEKSPANGAALSWYVGAKQRHSSSFPTDDFSLDAPAPSAGIKWANVANEPAKGVVKCPSCNASLSAPKDRLLRLTCPKCGNSFEAKL